MKLIAGAAIVTGVLFASGESGFPEPFFVKGNQLVYESIAHPEEGKITSEQVVLRIESVIAEGKSGVCEGVVGTVGDNGVKWNYRARFAYDSLNYYVHACNWMYESVQKEFNAGYRFEGDSLIYPFGMKVGDTLPSAYARRLYSAKGTKDIVTMNFIDRKVVSLDSISTPQGKMPGFKVETAIDTDVKYVNTYDGKANRDAKSKIIEWFVPSIGIVRMEYSVPGTGFYTMIMQKCRVE